jgi:uncharacterized protein (TIGR02271 family)
MSRTQSTIVAIFRNTSDAQAAVNELEQNGFSQSDIYVTSDYSGPGLSTAGTPSAYDTASRHEGGISGWFNRVFGGEDEADRPHYEDALRSGNIVVSVDVTDENLDLATNILNRHSPIDIQGEGGARGSGAGRADTARTGYAAPQRGTNESQAIPVVQEELQVGKRAVARGGVRVYSRLIEQPVEETVQLREERVRVERRPVNRPAEPSEIRGEDQVIEVQEYAEEPVVTKQARVVEEVRVGKEATERSETVRDTVRRTEVNVENLKEANTGRAGYTDDFDIDFRRNFDTNYASTGATYDTYAPAYRYGYEMANDPRYRGKDFSAVESDLRSDYGQRYPNSTWERMKDSIRYGWDKVTGKTRSANQ